MTTKRKRITELESIVDEQVELMDQALNTLLDQHAEIITLKDELNAREIVVAGALAKVRALTAANQQAQEYVHNAQDIIISQGVRIAELEQDLSELSLERDARSFMESEADFTGYPGIERALEKQFPTPKYNTETWDEQEKFPS